MSSRHLRALLKQLRQVAGELPSSTISDAHLLNQLTEHQDKSAFLVIVQRYGLMVRELCRRWFGQQPAAMMALASIAVGASLAIAHGLAPRPASNHLSVATQAAFQAADDVPRPHPAASRTDLYGDPLPPGALARMGTVRLRQGGGIAPLAFSTDGKVVITGSASKVCFWDARTGKVQRQVHLPMPPKAVLAQTVLTPDGKTLAARQTADTILVWDVTGGKGLRRITFPRRKNESSPPILEGYGLALSDDGRFMAGHLGGLGLPRVCLWDLRNGQVKTIVEGPSMSQLAFSADGRMLAVGTFRKSMVYDTATGNALATLPRQANGVTFTPDGRQLATVEDHGTVTFWDVATGKQQAALHGPDVGGFGAMRFSADAKLLAVGGQRAVVLWDMTARKLRHHWPALGAGYLAFSPHGKTLATSGRGVIHLWDTATGKEVCHYTGHQTIVTLLAFSPDGKQIAAGSTDVASGLTLRLWDARTGKPLRLFADRSGWGQTLQFAPDGRFLVAAEKNEVVFWNLTSGQQMTALTLLPPAPPGQSAMVSALQVLPNGRQLVAITQSGSDVRGVLRLELLTADRVTRQILSRRSLPRQTWSRAFSPDGSLLALWDLRTLRVEETATGRPLSPMDDLLGDPLAFSADGRLLATGVYVGHFGMLAPGEEPAHKVATSVREVATGKEVSRLATGRAGKTAFSPDGRLLICTDARAVRVWELLSGKEVLHYEATDPHESFNDSFAFALAVAPDGRSVATALPDTTILVWDLTPAARAPAPRTRLKAKEMEALWADLAGDDAARAYRAIGTLSTTPALAVPFLRAHLHPVAAADPQKLQRLIKDLDSRRFAVREAAAKQLAQQLDVAEATLQTALTSQISPESRRRMQALLAQRRVLSSADLRALRALAVLERIGSPDARQVLTRLTQGVACARLTREAQAALDRLDRSQRKAR